MSENKSAKYAIPLVLFAGLLWSFGPFVVRNIDDAGSVPWQYLFTRGVVIFLLLNIYLYLEEGKNFYKNYSKRLPNQMDFLSNKLHPCSFYS